MERFKLEITITPEMCYDNGGMRPDAWFVWLQNAGTEHLNAMEASKGFGMPDNLAWVLLEVTAKIDQLRKAGEKLLLETFPVKGTSAMFPRRYICRDIMGKIVTTADTTWALMDVVRRRMTRSAVMSEKLVPYEEIDDGLALLSPIKEIEGEAVTEVFTPLDTDFDVNGHVNNTRYIAWICDRINKLGGIAKEIHCRYHSEILPGQEALIALRESCGRFFCEICSREPDASNTAFDRSGAKLCFAASVVVA
jgi:acyl-ACP thioesterase